MSDFDWKLWGKSFLVALAGAVVSSLLTSATYALSGTPITLKAVGVSAASAALPTVIAYFKKSPLASAAEQAQDKNENAG